MTINAKRRVIQGLGVGRRRGHLQLPGDSDRRGSSQAPQYAGEDIAILLLAGLMHLPWAAAKAAEAAAALVSYYY